MIQIAKLDDGSLRARLIRIDRSADPFPFTSVTFNAPDLTLAQDFGGVSVKGKLSADGHSIDGTWTQIQQSSPLTLTLAAPETAWRYEGPAPVAAMAATADPAFDVAVIKPTGPDENNTLFDLRSRKFTSQHTSAKELIKIAYNLRGRQVIGGPSWLEEDKFDIVAEPDTPGMPSEQQVRSMVRKLLEDRFHLVVHTGEQPFTVLAVTLDPKAVPLIHTDPTFKGAGMVAGHATPDGQAVITCTGETISDFLAFIMNVFQQSQLVDESGLTEPLRLHPFHSHQRAASARHRRRPGRAGQRHHRRRQAARLPLHPQERPAPSRVRRPHRQAHPKLGRAS